MMWSLEMLGRLMIDEKSLPSDARQGWVLFCLGTTWIYPNFVQVYQILFAG